MFTGKFDYQMDDRKRVPIPPMFRKQFESAVYQAKGTAPCIVLYTEEALMKTAEIIEAIPAETDEAKLKEMYTKLVEIYLTDIPSFTLMYRPQSFHTVNESVWTNFPHQDDGTNPPVPPLDLTDGWSIAGLYNLTLVNP